MKTLKGNGKKAIWSLKFCPLSSLSQKIEEPEEDDDDKYYGRGSRARREVDYSDSLTEREWLKAIGASVDEEGNEIIEDEDDELYGTGGPPKRGRGRGRTPAGPGSRGAAGRGRGQKRKLDFEGEEGAAGGSGGAGGGGGSGVEDGRGSPGVSRRGRGRGGGGGARGGKKPKVEIDPRTIHMMRKLMRIVVGYTDSNDRRLSDPFMHLPSRKELPDYYKIIKKPLDIHKIRMKISNHQVGAGSLINDHLNC